MSGSLLHLGRTVTGLGATMMSAGLHKFFPGLYLGWGLGANDSANVFGTAVATRVISYHRAVVLMAVFVVLGSWMQGPGMMKFFSKFSTLDPTAAILAALAAGISMHLMTLLGIPSSSSQAIVGSVIGIGVLDGTARFGPLVKVVICWIATPIGAALVSFVFFAVFRYLFEHFVTNIGVFDRLVAWGIIGAGCYGAYSLGANNVANVCGVYVTAGLLGPEEAALLGGVGIALGALTYSYRVMMTVGTKITPLDPFSAAVATLAAAVTVHAFVWVKVPVSTSQAAVGAVVGIGLFKGLKTVSKSTLVECVLGWIATPIIAAVFAAGLVAGVRALG